MTTMKAKMLVAAVATATLAMGENTVKAEHYARPCGGYRGYASPYYAPYAPARVVYPAPVYPYAPCGTVAYVPSPVYYAPYYAPATVYRATYASPSFSIGFGYSSGGYYGNPGYRGRGGYHGPRPTPYGGGARYRVRG